MQKLSTTHHDICGACTDISIENTPYEFPLPGEVAEEICRDNPSWALTHRKIALAIAERDRVWSERITIILSKKEITANNIRADASLKDRVRGVTGAVLIPLLAYLLVGYSAMDSDMNYLPTYLDTLVQESTVWVFPYVLMYVVSFAPVCAVRDTKLIRRWVWTVLIMYMFAIPIWVFLPVSVPRAPIVGDSFSVFLLELIRLSDPPTNCFPSMHVGIALLSGMIIREVDKLVGTVLLCAVPVIWYSTIAIGQHWAVDGIVGGVLALGSYCMMARLNPLGKESLGRIDRRSHALWLSLFFFPMIFMWIIWRFI